MSFELQPPYGFHPVAKTQILVDKKEGCVLNLRYSLPAEIFIDPYELANYASYYSFRYTGSRNLELPVHALDKVQNAELWLTLTEEAKDVVDVPLHLRYAEPLEGDEERYRTISISPPEVLLACSESHHYTPLSIANNLFGKASFEGKSIAQIPQNMTTATIMLPAGHYSHLPVVETGTAGVFLACFVYLTYSLWKTSTRLDGGRVQGLRTD